MSTGPAPKRRRITSSGDEAVAVSVALVHRKDDEIRRSLQDLHTSLEEFGDVLVCVEGEHGAKEEFPCVSAMLAASSRPLGAMLFGALRAATPQTGEERPRLQLRLTEPKHFKNLLRFIHGQDIRAHRATMRFLSPVAARPLACIHLEHTHATAPFPTSATAHTTATILATTHAIKHAPRMHSTAVRLLPPQKLCVCTRVCGSP